MKLGDFEKIRREDKSEGIKGNFRQGYSIKSSAVWLGRRW